MFGFFVEEGRIYAKTDDESISLFANIMKRMVVLETASLSETKFIYSKTQEEFNKGVEVTKKYLETVAKKGKITAGVFFVLHNERTFHSLGLTYDLGSDNKKTRFHLSILGQIPALSFYRSPDEDAFKFAEIFCGESFEENPHRGASGLPIRHFFSKEMSHEEWEKELATDQALEAFTDFGFSGDKVNFEEFVKERLHEEHEL